MEALTINQAKCIKCEKCIEECPGDVLELKPSLHVRHPELCISCGHCAAICPQSVIASSDKNDRNPFDIIEIKDELPLNRRLFHTKRSVRKFLDKVVELDKLSEIFEYAEKAPSSHNFRNREYLVITNAEDIAQISLNITKKYTSLKRILNPLTLSLISLFSKNAYKELKELVAAFTNLIEKHKQGNDKIFRNSKCIVCIAAPSGSTHSKDDCIASQHYMMLFAHSIGIDSYIVGYAQHAHRVIEKHFKMKPGFSIYAVCALGYAKNTYCNEIVFKPPQIQWK